VSCVRATDFFLPTLKDDPACTTELLAPGATGSLTFSAPGTYALICKIHATMSATIEVTQ